MSMTVDTSAIDGLVAKLNAAGDKVEEETAKVLDDVGEKVRAEASATAGGYPHATGELAGNVAVTGSGTYIEVGSTVRQGWYLANGSPSTGGPRPWLDAPAERGAAEAGEKLAKVDVGL